MPNNITYTPPQMGPAVAQLAENYNDALNVFDRIEDSIEYSKDGTQYESDLVAARAEIAEDDALFEDISDAVQALTGQAEPYDKDELAQAIGTIDTFTIPIDENSEVSELVAGINANGFYFSSNPNDKTDVLFGVDENDNLYVMEGSANNAGQ